MSPEEGPKALKVVRVTVTQEDPPGSRRHCCALVEAKVQDGREFSILAATPSWFEEAFRKLDLRCYYGPLILFVRKMDSGVVRRAVKDMAQDGDRWLCLYDTPHRTLPQVLADFKSRHA